MDPVFEVMVPCVSCVTIVSDEYAASIVRIEEGASTLKMAAAGSLVPVCRSARCHI